MQFEAKFFGANYRPLGIKLLVLLLLKQGPSFDVFSGTENRCTFFGGSPSPVNEAFNPLEQAQYQYHPPLETIMI